MLLFSVGGLGGGEWTKLKARNDSNDELEYN